MTTIEQFITENNVRLDTLSGPEKVPLHDGWSVYRNRYRLRLSSDHHHSYDFEYLLGWALNAEDTYDVALILATLIAGENYYRSGEASAGEHDAATQKMGDDLVLLLGGEESYAALVDDALNY